MKCSRRRRVVMRRGSGEYRIEPPPRCGDTEPTSTTVPAVIGALLPDTAYSYTIYGRTDFSDPDGTSRCLESDGIGSVRFSTGATQPPP